MQITVTFPTAVAYTGTHKWFVDPKDGWTVADLRADIEYAARVTGHILARAGVALDEDSMATDALSDGDFVDLVPDGG